MADKEFTWYEYGVECPECHGTKITFLKVSFNSNAEVKFIILCLADECNEVTEVVDRFETILGDCMEVDGITKKKDEDDPNLKARYL